MVTPTDLLYAQQWHFSLIGDIEKIWREYTGAGVNVGVYDDGVEYTHPDLAANYDATLHVVDDANAPIDPTPIDDVDGHGTSCAGIIGAAANGVGGVGVAYGVTLTGVNIDFSATGLYGSVNAADTAGFLDVVQQAASRFDVMSNSWGGYPSYDNGGSLKGDGFDQATSEAYAYLSANGRNGLGTIVLQAAGNDNQDLNGEGVNASRYTISVAATRSDGMTASYSQYGAAVLVAAPAASVTTDRSGTAGYDKTDYASDFGGTSAATPVVSGVVALMLQANAGIGWRDVQNILANSATLTGSAFNARTHSLDEEGTWYANASNSWNGGGNHVHTNYGYGMVNAFNAVRMAEVWSLFGPAQTSANERHLSSGLNDFADTVVPEEDPAGFSTTFTISGSVEIEHVALSLDFATDWVGDMRVELTSAEGTTVVVALQSSTNGYATDTNWVFGVDSLRGELAAGTWKLRVLDAYENDALTVRSAQLDIYGQRASANDTYHFTDEYVEMVGFDPSRARITDTDGGTDWLNMAAVTADIALNMRNGEKFSFDGRAFGSLQGRFENIVTGDGHDHLVGNGRANQIHGMRGRDTLDGGGGSDSLVGGMGNDKLKGGRGNDAFAYDDPDMGRDKILDFGKRGKDVIDLSAFDADTSTLADDAFAFIGLSRFSGAAGELRYRLKDGDAVVLGDMDGDGRADFAIKVRGIDTLQSDDFVL